MSEEQKERFVLLTRNNWYSWDRYIQGAIRRKKAYCALDPPPVDPRTIQQAPAAASAGSSTATGTSQGTTTTTTPTAPTTPTNDEVKAYVTAMEKWSLANDVAAGLILGSLSTSVELVVNSRDHANVMYSKLEAHALKKSSGTSALAVRAEMVKKRFEETPTMDNFEIHIHSFRTSNARLAAVNAAFDDHLLAWTLLHSLCDREEPFWSVAITNIVTSATPVNQWSFEDVAEILCEAVRSNAPKAGKSSVSTSQAALNANASKPNGGRYSGAPCTHPGCPRPKSHATDDCWTKEREERKKESEGQAESEESEEEGRRK